MTTAKFALINNDRACGQYCENFEGNSMHARKHVLKFASKSCQILWKPLNKFKGHYPINKARAYNAEVKDLFKTNSPFS